MITLPQFKELDQTKPVQILLDVSGQCGCCFEWYDCEIVPDADNRVLESGRVITINNAQSLRNTPPTERT